MKNLLFIMVSLSAFNCSPVRESFYAFRTEKHESGTMISYSYGDKPVRDIDLKSLDSLLRRAEKVELFMHDHITITCRDASAKQDSIVINKYDDRYSVPFRRIQYILVDDADKINVGVFLTE